MKIRNIILVAIVLIAMIGEWKFAIFLGGGEAIHAYHGVCNGGVGEPYKEFIHQLRTIAESGDTNRLVVVLRRADEHSEDIYNVWLGDGLSQNDAYRKSLAEILK